MFKAVDKSSRRDGWDKETETKHEDEVTVMVSMGKMKMTKRKKREHLKKIP